VSHPVFGWSVDDAEIPYRAYPSRVVAGLEAYQATKLRLNLCGLPCHDEPWWMD
jgi:hypothetical protein